MSLTKQQTVDIDELLTNQILRKLNDYKAETSVMPFHVRLLGKDRMALFSFIQSINTTLGTSVFEQTAVIIAKPRFKKAISQYKDFNNTISQESQNVIQSIMNELSAARKTSDKIEETKTILSVARSGELISVKKPRIDLFLETMDNEEIYVDIKTAKPNAPEFKGFKRTLLEWVAIRGALNNDIKVKTLLAIPYNPYEPEPYQRWTLQGLFDLKNELLVGEEFWDYLGGKNTYNELLNVVEKVGIKLRPEIDSKFAKFK